MICFRSALLALFTLPLHAGVVDVSQSETALVRTGDILAFDLFTWNYGLNAQAFGLPLYPTDVNFVLVTNALTLPAQFTATLASADAPVSGDTPITVAFDGSLDFAPGYLSCTNFMGAVSTLQGHLHLSSALSRDLFSGGHVLLNLQNTGEDVNLGLAPLVLRQDLFFILSGGGLSVGAVPGAVTLESLPDPEFQLRRGPVLFSAIPEPDSWWLLLGGGMLLCVVSALWNRRTRLQR